MSAQSEAACNHVRSRMGPWRSLPARSRNLLPCRPAFLPGGLGDRVPLRRHLLSYLLRNARGHARDRRRRRRAAAGCSRALRGSFGTAPFRAAEPRSRSCDRARCHRPRVSPLRRRALFRIPQRVAAASCREHRAHSALPATPGHGPLVACGGREPRHSGHAPLGVGTYRFVRMADRHRHPGSTNGARRPCRGAGPTRACQESRERERATRGCRGERDLSGRVRRDSLCHRRASCCHKPGTPAVVVASPPGVRGARRGHHRRRRPRTRNPYDLYPGLPALAPPVDDRCRRDFHSRRSRQHRRSDRGRPRGRPDRTAARPRERLRARCSHNRGVRAGRLAAARIGRRRFPRRRIRVR